MSGTINIIETMGSLNSQSKILTQMCLLFSCPQLKVKSQQLIWLTRLIFTRCLTIPTSWLEFSLCPFSPHLMVKSWDSSTCSEQVFSQFHFVFYSQFSFTTLFSKRSKNWLKSWRWMEWRWKTIGWQTSCSTLSCTLSQFLCFVWQELSY